ncbi:hypothetical protein NL64_16300 [Pseudomonas fluorescens]|nr:hypothetical protein NL64_16300 [Pseudomonas fluorescens]
MDGVVLLKIYIYYLKRTQSSRRLEREAERRSSQSMSRSIFHFSSCASSDLMRLGQVGDRAGKGFATMWPD